MRFFSDLDGTLCHTPHGIDYDDGAALLAHCQPRPAALQEIVAAQRLGHEVGILTYRGAHVADATHQQLHAWLGPAAQRLVAVEHRPRLVFDWSHYVADKEAILRRHHAELYIGDRAEDRAAALRAGAAFLWDRDWEAHGLRALRLVIRRPA